MRKVLLMPFLRLPSGHHQVASALSAWLKRCDPSLICEQVDLFSYAYHKMETIVSRSYLRAITFLPTFYRWLYRKNAYENKEKDRFLFYDFLFSRALLKLLAEKKPDLIVCTHALPSYLLNRLKLQNMLHTPVVNAYTDYFINSIWGRKKIDFHLVPDMYFKYQLLKEGVARERIYVTGIPLHPAIKRRIRGTEKSQQSSTLNLLVTGGSLGVGGILSLIRQVNRFEREGVHYYILCGHNKPLYEKLKAEASSALSPLLYIKSREAMNLLYNQVDGIVTKPGGITITESLYKQIPIFIYEALPGQEEMNVTYLLLTGLAFDLQSLRDRDIIWEDIFEQLSSREAMEAYQSRVSHYHHRIDGNLMRFLRQLFTSNNRAL